MPRGGSRYRGISTNGFSRPSKLHLKVSSVPTIFKDIKYARRGRAIIPPLPHELVPSVSSMLSSQGRSYHPAVAQRPQTPFPPRFGEVE